MRRLPNPILTAALVSSAATAAVVFVPALRFAYRLPQLHVALETAAALIGLLAAYLVFGRFRRSGQLDDFMLCYSLGLLAFSNLFFAAHSGDRRQRIRPVRHLGEVVRPAPRSACSSLQPPSLRGDGSG